MSEEGALEVGERVVDGDVPSDEREAAVVIEIPGETAEQSYIADLDTTVADVNPDYPPDDPVATVAFVDDLDTWASGWEFVSPDALADELGTLGTVALYTYPVSRLSPVKNDV